MEGRWQKKSLLQRNGRGAAPLLGRKRSRLSGARRSRARRQRRAGGRRRRRRRRSSSEDSWSPKTQTGRRLPVAGGALEARVFQRKRRSAVDGPIRRQPIGKAQSRIDDGGGTTGVRAQGRPGGGQGAGRQLTPKRRREIARKAAAARWGKGKENKL